MHLDIIERKLCLAYMHTLDFKGCCDTHANSMICWDIQVWIAEREWVCTQHIISIGCIFVFGVSLGSCNIKANILPIYIASC